MTNKILEFLKKGLRAPSEKGNLTLEQVCNLKLTDLAKSVKLAKSKLGKTDVDGLDFLEETTRVNATDQLIFDVLKEVYIDKKSEADAIKLAADNKAHNNKILELIASKQNQALEGKTIEELEAMLKN